MKQRLCSFILLCLLPAMAQAGDNNAYFLRKPTVSKTHIVFSCGGDLWSVSRQGGDATRLTSGSGVETDPYFSPDGTQIAFTGEYEGNVDIYVMPAAGGLPKRLTYHPGSDQIVGWTPDGKNILFRSIRNSATRSSRLFTVPVAGGYPTEIPLPMAFEGTYSPDGSRMAYVPLPPAFTIWKRYRGGRASSIWLADLSDSRVEALPRENSNDFNPMWVGGKVFFLSDRNGSVTLFSYDAEAKKVTQVLPNEGLDLKNASAGPDAIVYEQFGDLHLFDPTTGHAHKVDVRIASDLPTLRPRFVKANKFIHNAALSPSGARAAFEVRGEIITLPAEKGDPRNLTNTPGVSERDPAWSPDGKQIAYFSDASGEYQLHVREASGFSAAKPYALGKAPTFYFAPIWAPDGKHILYRDKRLNLWTLELATGTNKLVDTDHYDDPAFDPVWSPDGQWVAYTKQLKSHLRAVFLYSLETKQAKQITDGMSDARFPAFDQSGKYLYFTASTDAGAVLGWEMSNIGRPVTRTVYALVLRHDLPSPLSPESDEEKDKDKDKAVADKSKDKDKDKPKDKDVPEKTRIDVDDADYRIIALPIPAKNYTGLVAGKAGILFLLEGPVSPLAEPSVMGGGPPTFTLHKFDLDKRKVEQSLEGISNVQISANREKFLYRQGENWFITGTTQPKAGEGKLKLDAAEVRVEPRAEWQQMYREVWRLERDFLYAPNFHGLDLQAAERKYAPYLDRLTTRADLNYLFAEMLGELTLGHVYIGGGDFGETKRVPGGLLGADYVIENGRYRLSRVYTGGSWDPKLRAPLAQPGSRVKAGEYLLAVNGQELSPPMTPEQLLEATAGKQVVLKVGPNADGSGAREVTVVPVPDEYALRHAAWIEDNRRKVDELSGGRIAYVYVPDTFFSGQASFVRYFFAQVGKDGVVIDERFNGGGIVPDYIVDTLRRPLIGYVSTREGEDTTLPMGAIFGPRAMLINEMAGSGGDELPRYFRATKAGPLIGKRTWGGLVGIGDYPPLMDGGGVTAPNAAFWFPSGEWEVENRGVAPDIEVEYDPRAVRAGKDPQLEKAVEVVLAELKRNPPAKPKRPAYPNYHPAKGAPSTQGNPGATPPR